MKRRVFFASGLGLAGALIVGWGLLPQRSRLGAADTMPVQGGEVGLNGWIKIAADGTVWLAMPKAEMGQGVFTALAMMVAEELDVAPAKVRLVQAGHESLYGNVTAAVDSMLFFEPSDTEPGQETRSLRLVKWLFGKAMRELGINATGGSSSISDAYLVLPQAAATARAQLLAAAAAAWAVPVRELTINEGVVRHAPGTPAEKRAHFGELAKAAAALTVSEVHVKPRDQWRVLGTLVPRTDVPAKLDGSAIFGIDVRQPGQLYAAIVMSPTLGGSPGVVDSDAVLKRPGVLRVVRVPPYAGAPEAVAIVARSTWQALAAARALSVSWSPAPGPVLDSTAILGELQAQASRAAREGTGFAFRSRGDAAAVIASAGRTLEASYRAPYLAHATMEPMNCTARVADGRVELWAPTQVSDFARDIAAKVAGVDKAAVTVHTTLLGGGFGRRLEVDFIAQAVRVAQECGGAPVQLLWPREEDMAHDFYRPAAAAVMRAALDDKGQVTALAVGTAGDAIMPRYYERVFPLMAMPIDLPDKTTAEGLFDLPYDIAHLRVRHVATRSGVPVGSWRSVGHSQNAFFGESFVDELAHAAQADPVAFRLARLAQLPRHAAVLKLAAERAGWSSPLPAGQARGVALHESFGSIVAMVAEVSIDATTKSPRVHRVVAAVDCGTVIHPGGVAQQVEGSVAFGLSAALHGRIDVVAGAVTQRSFADYPVLGLAAMPLVQTHIVTSTRHPGGMGEPAVPPVAPAVANALFALTGKRLRELPLVI